MNFSEKIKELRLNKNLSLTIFCKKLGEDVSNWSKIERNILNPPKAEDAIFLKIKKVLELSDKELADLKILACVQREEMPRTVITEADAIKSLPIFWCRANGVKPSRTEVEKLVNCLINS